MKNVDNMYMLMDLLFIRNYVAMFDKFKKSIMNEFKMFNMNLMHYFLGIEVIQSIYGNFSISKELYYRNFE